VTLATDFRMLMLRQAQHDTGMIHATDFRMVMLRQAHASTGSCFDRDCYETLCFQKQTENRGEIRRSAHVQQLLHSESTAARKIYRAEIHY
jgi:hypothetical protein